MNTFYIPNPSAASITKNAGRQTYYTVKYLVDRDLIPDAYKAYAHFRWVDDCLDDNGWAISARATATRIIKTCISLGPAPILGQECPLR